MNRLVVIDLLKLYFENVKEGTESLSSLGTNFLSVRFPQVNRKCRHLSKKLPLRSNEIQYLTDYRNLRLEGLDCPLFSLGLVRRRRSFRDNFFRFLVTDLTLARSFPQPRSFLN